MFDIGWSELMILGVIALIVVGPKELPALLRTVGRYTGFLRKQAAEFRSQIDEAMREAELDQLKKDVQGFKDDITGTVRSAAKSLTDEIDNTKRQLEFPELDDADAHDADGMPISRRKHTEASPAPTETSALPSAEPDSQAGAETAAQEVSGEPAAPSEPAVPQDATPLADAQASQPAGEPSSVPSETSEPRELAGSRGNEQRSLT